MTEVNYRSWMENGGKIGGIQVIIYSHPRGNATLENSLHSCLIYSHIHGR
jgi:hypothetical protein